jgi:hypothetical protein
MRNSFVFPFPFSEELQKSKSRVEAQTDLKRINNDRQLTVSAYIYPQGQEKPKHDSYKGRKTEIIRVRSVKSHN